MDYKIEHLYIMTIIITICFYKGLLKLFILSMKQINHDENNKIFPEKFKNIYGEMHAFEK